MSRGVRAFLKVTSGFFPLIMLWSFPNQYALILGMCFAAIVLLKGLASKSAGIMSVVLFVYLAVSNMLYFFYKTGFVLDKKCLISYAILSCTGFISVMLRKPYTMYDAKNAYEEGFGDSPMFIEVNILITKIWSVIYLMNTVMELFGHNVYVIVLSNLLIACGITASVTIPNLLPEI